MEYHVYSASGKMTSNSQTLELEVRVGAWDFYCEDITIIGYDKIGNIFGIGNTPRDRFTAQMRNISTGDTYFDNGIDIAIFSPLLTSTKKLPANTRIAKNTVLAFELVHQPVVTNAVQYDITWQVIMSGQIDKPVSSLN